MPRRPPLPLSFALALALAAGAGCRREPPPQLDIYSHPEPDELARLQLDAQNGDRLSQRELGRRLLGGDGVPRDAAQATHWFRLAAEQGDDQAQVALALQIFRGEGTTQDRPQAVRWWQKAAAGGNGDAQATLGWIYAEGVDVPVDRVLGYAWYNLAAANGILRAQAQREALEKKLSKRELIQAQQLSSAWYAQIGAKLAPGVREGRLQKVGEGTAFLVGKDGDAVTAAHVVAGCVQLRLRARGGIASVRALDRQHDLALVHVPGEIADVAVLASNPGDLRQGDEVVVFGYPLNAWLSNGGNLTPGSVSALTGMGNDPNQIQVTAPIQPGSSGSPVLDQRGVVVGVVSMHLSDARMVEATGSSGQNLNFAVSGLRLNDFLRRNRAEFRTGGFWRLPRPNADIADEARRYTVVIECWK